MSSVPSLPRRVRALYRGVLRAERKFAHDPEQREFVQRQVRRFREHQVRSSELRPSFGQAAGRGQGG